MILRGQFKDLHHKWSKKNPLKIALIVRASAICKNFKISKYYLISVGVRHASLKPVGELFNQI